MPLALEVLVRVWFSVLGVVVQLDAEAGGGKDRIVSEGMRPGIFEANCNGAGKSAGGAGEKEEESESTKHGSTG